MWSFQKIKARLESKLTKFHVLLLKYIDSFSKQRCHSVLLVKSFLYWCYTSLAILTKHHDQVLKLPFIRCVPTYTDIWGCSLDEVNVLVHMHRIKINKYRINTYATGILPRDFGFRLFLYCLHKCNFFFGLGGV